MRKEIIGTLATLTAISIFTGCVNTEHHAMHMATDGMIKEQ